MSKHEVVALAEELSKNDQLWVIKQIADLIAAERSGVPIESTDGPTPEQLIELRRIRQDYLADPNSARPWREVFEERLRKYNR